MIRIFLWLLLLVQFSNSMNVANAEVVPSSQSGYSVIDGVYFRENILIYYPSDKDGTVYAIPEGTAGIAANAFCDALELEFLIIPTSCKYIGVDEDTLVARDVYTWSSDFGHVKGYCVAPDNQSFVSRDGALFSKDGSMLYQYPLDNEALFYSVPEGVKKIAPYAFYTTSLQTIAFPDSLLYIGEKAFYGSCLKSVVTPPHLHTIASYAFASSNKLENVSFESGLKVIDAGAFEGCSISAVVLPQTLEHLGDFAFFGNPVANDDIIVLPVTLQHIGDNIFEFGSSSWDTWSPIYAVHPQSMGHLWAENNQYSYVFVSNDDECD